MAKREYDENDRICGNCLHSQQFGKWIPCGDRLPEKDCCCLVTTSDGGVDIRGYLCSKGWGWDGFDFDRIIAWMPLPEGYVG